MSQPSYADRARAESFGAVAADYDRFRPSYPDELIADLIALAPARALDVGCGTGKVAVALLASGLAVLGLEVDPAMAAVARSHGLFVEVGAFEDWDAGGRTFDLITCGQAWHWIDPARGVPKAAQLLNAHGTIALFWNYDKVDDDIKSAFDAVYDEHAPELADNDPSSRVLTYHEAFEESDRFDSVERRRYHWERTYTADEWVGRAATHSDHIALPDDRRQALLAGLRAVVEAAGGSVQAHFTTYVILARTPE